MPDFNPNEMDALFREGAERHEFEYNPNAWALMEEKLDRNDQRRRIVFYIVGLLMIALVAGIYLYMSSGEENVPTEVATLEQPIETNESVFVQQKEVDASEEMVTTNKINESSSAQKTINDNTISKEYIATDSKESRSNIGAQNSFQTENTGNLMGNEIVSIDSEVNTPVDANVAFENNDDQEEIIKESSTLNIPAVDNKKNEILMIPFLRSKDLESFNTIQNHPDGSELEFTQAATRPITLNSANRFALTLFANPEWSSAALFRDSKAGWSFGTRFGYQFSNNFELSAGVALSRKIYKGTGTEYTMDGGWYQDIEPMRMDAKCDVIEIPVSLAYYINGFRNSGFFADLGISSYMLHSEWYGFSYNDALVRPIEYVDVVAEDENSHLVGVGRFSIGYQKVFTDNTSLQIAPYLQFPLTGIGAGQVNLYSSGVQVAVKFNTQ